MTLIPIPQTTRLARRLEQDPGDLASVDEHVVRPLHERRHHGLALERRRHREPRDERKLREKRTGGTLEPLLVPLLELNQHRYENSGPIQPAPRSYPE